MNSYINLGPLTEKDNYNNHSKKRRHTSRATGQVWVRFAYPQFTEEVLSWRLDNHQEQGQDHIIEYKGFKNKYVIGHVEKKFDDEQMDKILLIMSGPFKSLRAAKAAYMLEIS